MERKTKIFLGAFINYTNAQNLNCLAIAKHLDKDKFEVFTLELFSGNLESNIGKIQGVKIFKCFKPFRISGYLGFLWGIWNCDVAYLPKHELWKFNRFLLWLFNKKSFSTMEGIIDDENMKSMLETLGSYNKVLEIYKSTNELYPITSYLGKYNSDKHGIRCNIHTLYLGCDTNLFRNDIKRGVSIKTIVYIGRLKKRKGIYDIFQLAKLFPSIKFLIYGNGEEENNLKKIIGDQEIDNIELRDVIPHTDLAKVFEHCDLHVLPSRSEGFPKVILETAAAGVPSIVYSDYGADEWMTSGVNGWVVDTLENMKQIIQSLIDNPQLLQKVSSEAVKLADSFDWKVRIKEWEEVIIQLNNK